MALISCPSCHHQVSTEAVACPSCGHQFKAPKTNSALNAIDYTGIGMGFLGIVLFLVGAMQGSKGSQIMLAAFVIFIVGLLVCAVGRIKAKQ
jgi:uncharacterized membrane protein YvbJ